MLINIFAPGNVHLLEVAGVRDALFEANCKIATGPPYRVQLVTELGMTEVSASGVKYVPDAGIRDATEACDTLIVTGPYSVPMALSDDATQWLRAQALHARRYGSTCTGAFLLARAGLLAGRRATTHWQYAERLAADYPDIQVEPDRISGNVVGAEALVRWNHGVFGLQPPARFIGIAEETGAILDIGAWGLRALAAHAARINRGRCTPLRFAFNASVVEFMRRDMVAFVEQVLDETGCRAEWLTLELTENLMITDPDHIHRVFGDLRRVGVGISIDDFGTGYSNLRYLECFPLSEIKIDRSFVHDAAHSAAKRIIVEGVVRLGAALGICVVAEGIETQAEMALMQALGCSVGQGYLFAAPMEDFQFERLLNFGSDILHARGLLTKHLGDGT